MHARAAGDAGCHPGARTALVRKLDSSDAMKRGSAGGLPAGSHLDAVAAEDGASAVWTSEALLEYVESTPQDGGGLVSRGTASCFRRVATLPKPPDILDTVHPGRRCVSGVVV